jgi:hypothetical protein
MLLHKFDQPTAVGGTLQDVDNTLNEFGGEFAPGEAGGRR